MLASMTTRALSGVAFVLAIAAALFAAFGPTYTSCGSSADRVTTCSHASGFAVNGWWILVVASVPVVLTLMPLLTARRRVLIACSVLLWIGCVLALLSVGIFFVPAAIALTIAAARSDRTPTSAVR
jgi:hypothetical protein